MSDQPTSRPSDTRQNINDGPIEFDDYISMNRAALEVFFRSMLKPINDNETDAKGKNFIVEENFSFEPLKRLYFQDFYKSLLSTEKMYGMVKCDPVNDTWTTNDGHTKTVVANSVKIQGNTEIGDLDTAINNTVGAMDAVEIDESHFHSTIEFTENASNRNVGLYDYGKLPGVNASGELFQLGLLEQVFKEEEELFKEDIRREHNIVSYQTIARRLTELFARLSNIRLSMLFWTDKANNYSKQWAVAALDIFYNLMSRLSEAHRINLQREYAGVQTTIEYTREEVIFTERDNRPLNVLIWIDASASMTNHIKELTKKIKSVVEYVKNEVNSDCKIGFLIGRGDKWEYPYKGSATFCCNFTNNTTILKNALEKYTGGGDECIAGLMNAITSMQKRIDSSDSDNPHDKVYQYVNKIKYASSCVYVWGNATTKKLQWDPGAKRIVIVFSDEPVDNYTSMCARKERKHHKDSKYNTKWDLMDADGNFDSKGTRQKVNQYDNTTYTYYCLPTKGAYRTYNPSDGRSTNPKWVVCPGWQFNNTWDWHTGSSSDPNNTQKVKLNWKNTRGDNPEFTRAQFVNAFINPGLPVNADGTHLTPTAQQLRNIKENVTELHWVYYSSGTGDSNCIDNFKTLITNDILVPISKANNGNGASIINANSKSNLATVLKSIFKNRSDEWEVKRIKEIPHEKKKNIGDPAAVGLTYARAARLNKTYADMMRPCVFVPNLVSAMMMLAQSKMVEDKKLPPETPHQDWSSLLGKVIDENKGNFTWFGRTNEPKKDRQGNIILLKDGMYVGPNQSVGRDEKTALNEGGNYAESLTGIHLKLIDKPTGAGWSDGTGWDSNDIKKALTGGLQILADAFIECLNDAEVMKVLDMSTSPPTPTNLPELMRAKGGNLANVGDLQFSLMLERIIAKVYKALNVKSSSYFRGNIPMLNMDFALRFLTDSTIKNKNELFKQDSTKYRKAYSNVVDYVNRVNEWKNSRRQLDEDTDYTLNNVVTTTQNSTRLLNPSFAHMLEEWSLCPYRFNESGSVVSNVGNSSAETEVGPTNSYGVSYSKKAPACPFAETVAPSAGEQGEPPCDRPHGCALHTFYEVPDTEVDGLVEKLELIPPNCPARALVNGILQQLHEQPQRIPYENSSQYIHALFKAVDENTNKLIDTKKEESKSMGYKSSSAIYEHITYPGETAPPSPPTYKDEVHSNVRLVYLDQLIRLCQDLFRVNMDIAFEEPYLKTKIERIDQHYYGSAAKGSFEPITCYRFTNFHALNDQDARSAAGTPARYQLKYYARTLGPQWVTAINRDLSGETAVSNSIWSRIDALDNEKTIEGTDDIESSKTYTSFNSYKDPNPPAGGQWPIYEKDGNKYMLTKEEIISGIIDPSHDIKNISRANDAEYPFYKIHLMDELVNVVTGGDGGNVKSSLTTFEVYVKRFRPIYLPNADDLFVSEDRDPLNPTADGVSIHATGWSMVPHKYSADAHLSKDAIIIPMNFGSRNSPRCGWFSELDYAFHKTVVQGDVAISGFYDEVNDRITTKTIVGKEYEDFYKYHYRDWLWPAAMMGHCHVSGDNGALATITDSIEKIRNADGPTGADGANDYIQGVKGSVIVQDNGDSDKNLVVTESNLKYFDIFKCADASVGQDTALNANWLYITTPAPGGGVEVSQCEFPLPWVFFHSSRGSEGAGPSNYYHGLGNRVTTNHETSFHDGQPNGMRFFAVDNVLSQKPVTMNLYGRSDVTLDNAGAAAFSKGFYDPSCCGTEETWHTHDSGYYGWPNGSNDKDGPRPDKYYLQYDSKGNNHVTGGTSLNSACGWTEYYSYKDGKIMRSPFNKYNKGIMETLKGKPMTWSLWNVVRHSLHRCFNVVDLDYDEDRVGCAINRTTLGATPEELEYKTGQSMRAMYKEWYQRFTYNGQYCSKSIPINPETGVQDGKNVAWPYKVEEDDPVDYIHAQRLMNGNGTAMSGGTCQIEWTNLVADMSIIYNEVSDTHNSCLTMYTGGHPNYQMNNNYHSTGENEFRGPGGAGEAGSGVQSTTIPTSTWVGTSAYPNADNSKPFRYALPAVDMCRNFMVLTYRGYNSPIPDEAYAGGVPKFEPHHSHPKELMVSREIQTTNHNGKALSRVSVTADATEYSAFDVLLDDIYPPSEEGDTEGCDSNFIQRLLVPCYPNWEDLHDNQGNPIYPDAVSDDDLKKIVFCVAPITYYNGLASGNGSSNKKNWKLFIGKDGKKHIKKGDGPAQMGERMMAFCVAQFFMGVDAEKMTSNLDTEFFEEIAKPNVCVIAPNLGHDYMPGDPAWGQGLVDPGNWDPSKWWRLS